MEENKNNKCKKIFKFILIFIMILYSFIYYAGTSGYYTDKIAKKTLITKEGIMRFEKDVAEGKAVDIIDYISDNNKDYTNPFSLCGYYFSKSVDMLLNDGVKEITNFLKTLFS